MPRTPENRPICLTGTQLLHCLGFDAEGAVVVKAPLPGNGLAVGTPVPLIDRSPEPPEYSLLNCDYPAVPLIKLLQTGDPTRIDSLWWLKGYKPGGRVTVRDWRALTLAKEGRTYEEIGLRLGGVTRQRVKQILDRLAQLGYAVPSTLEARNEQRQALREQTPIIYDIRGEAGVEDAAARLVGHARARCTQRGIPFDITPEDLRPLPTHCPVLGVALDYGASKGSGSFDNYASVDRIVPALGYVKGNVLVVSVKANRIKSDATPEELRLIADFYARYANPVSNP